jgi:ABC-type glycerol-3-phosphate transport system substrate-binding protein
MTQMPNRRMATLFAFLVILAPLPAFQGVSTASAQTMLRIYVGGQQRTDVIREIAESYTKANPGIRVEVETGGATPEAQQQYLNAALAARDPALDLALIDTIRPAQWLAAQWAEPLDAYLGAEKDARSGVQLSRAALGCGGDVPQGGKA